MSPDMKHLKNLLRASILAAALGVALPAGASAATGSIHGTVTKASDGAAVSQYAVDLYGSTRVKVGSVCTDGTGKYAFTGLATDSYYVSFSGDPAAPCAATGWAPRWYTSLQAKHATPVAVVDGADRPGIDTTLSPEGTVSGKVTEAAGGAGLPGVSARVIDTDGVEAGRACTAPDGTYEVRRLTPLPYIVQFVPDATCAPIGAYASRYYQFGNPAGAETAAGASAVSTDYGQDKSGIDVRLALPVQVVQRTLTVTTTGSGSVAGAAGGISCPGTCSVTRAQGTVVTLTPTAAARSTFTGWTGACSGAGACTVTLDGDKTVGATFAPTGGGVVPGGGVPSGGGAGGGAGGGTTGGGTGTPPVVVPPATPTPGGSGTSVPKAKCTVAAPSKVRRGRFTVKVRCDRKAKLVVGGTLKFKRGKKTTTVKLATSTSTATTKTVSIKVPAKAARALKAKAKLSATLTLRATTSGGTTSAGKKVARIR
ncbi:carboxypeptidase regulatory-like domain-containing protein [Patulibacter sp. NPDC049589]|uniref:carboxypeptidase regulatory-like domain-containing protein n=1 Tax=Patulibacter sp. NPDC049589 TaxID=3154731 RepID=UPI0034131D27